jgi:hypothetical protein
VWLTTVAVPAAYLLIGAGKPGCSPGRRGRADRRLGALPSDPSQRQIERTELPGGWASRTDGSASPVFVTCSAPLDGLNLKSLAGRASDLPDMAFVGSHDSISSSTDGTVDDPHVDDVVVLRSSGELADVATLFGAHGLDLAADKHAGETGLPRTASPSLGGDRSGDDWDNLLGDQADVERPHPPIIPVAGDESTRVVSNSGHYADGFDRDRPRSSRARASPAANSCSVRGPWSASPRSHAAAASL